MPAQKVLGIVGWKNSGKTTLIEALVKTMTALHLRISTIKHAHHAFEIDTNGKDSKRHRMAGAHEVLVASWQRWALMHELRELAEPSLDELVARLSPCDLVLAEGFKTGGHPKIEIVRECKDEGLIADRDENVLAVATDSPELAGRHTYLPLNDTAAIVEFISRRFQLL